MARNNTEAKVRAARLNHTYSSNREAKYCIGSPKSFKSITPPFGDGKHPTNVSSTTPTPAAAAAASPRTSPGLLAGHYAGCKFTEPPLPSALPLPPPHWMQQAPSVVLRARCAPTVKQEQPDQLTQQLKVLLKVQA